MVKIDSLALGFIPLFKALSADSPDDFSQFFNHCMVVLEEVSFGNANLHALLHEADCQLSERTQVLADAC